MWRRELRWVLLWLALSVLTCIHSVALMTALQVGWGSCQTAIAVRSAGC